MRRRFHNHPRISEITARIAELRKTPEIDAMVRNGDYEGAMRAIAEKLPVNWPDSGGLIRTAVVPMAATVRPQPLPYDPSRPMSDEAKQAVHAWGDEPKGDEPKGDEPKGDEPKGDEPKGDESEGT